MGTGLAPGLTLDENLVLKRFDRRPIARFGVLSTAAIASTADRLTTQFDIRGSRAGMPVSFLSGGNLQKAILARELAEEHVVLARRGADPRARSRRGADRARPRAPRTREPVEGRCCSPRISSEILELSDVVLVMSRGRIVGSFTREEVDVDAIGLLMTGTPAA